jgi:hypothetical protein
MGWMVSGGRGRAREKREGGGKATEERWSERRIAESTDRPRISGTRLVGLSTGRVVVNAACEAKQVSLDKASDDAMTQPSQIRFGEYSEVRTDRQSDRDPPASK